MTETIRRHAVEMEESGMLHPEVLELIYDQQLFKLFVPDTIGGRMTAFPEAIKCFEDTAYIDGSFGWLVQIGSGAGFFATVMNPHVVETLFNVRDFYIAGSDRPLGVAKKTPDGYLIDGTWPYASGADHASLFTVTCRIESGDTDNGLVRAFALTPDQVQIERDWNAFGLRATGSHTIHVKAAHVKANYRFDVAAPHFHYDNAVYHYPFEPFATANIAATAIGITRHFFDAARAHLEKQKATWIEKSPKRFIYAMQLLDEYETAFLDARKDFYEAVETSWTEHQNGQLIQSDDIAKTSKYVAHHGVHGVQSLFRHLGMDVVMKDHPLNHIYRDLMTVSQHGLLIDMTGDIFE
ncbi:acyl-CoA dehydrogenase [Salinicoccus sesuvii]|uniref:Acyl-CoA dehydrogenase n=1 Tax=Salinicoccus sesuvii TaxID=868281 RepID=A0ABV7N8F3_9STAP